MRPYCAYFNFKKRFFPQPASVYQPVRGFSPDRPFPVIISVSLIWPAGFAAADRQFARARALIVQFACSLFLFFHFWRKFFFFASNFARKFRPEAPPNRQKLHDENLFSFFTSSVARLGFAFVSFRATRQFERFFLCCFLFFLGYSLTKFIRVKKKSHIFKITTLHVHQSMVCWNAFHLIARNGSPGSSASKCMCPVQQDASILWRFESQANFSASVGLGLQCDSGRNPHPSPPRRMVVQDAKDPILVPPPTKKTIEKQTSRMKWTKWRLSPKLKS